MSILYLQQITDGAAIFDDVARPAAGIGISRIQRHSHVMINRKVYPIV